jgi:hypothetical protein
MKQESDFIDFYYANKHLAYIKTTINNSLSGVWSVDAVSLSIPNTCDLTSRLEGKSSLKLEKTYFCSDDYMYAQYSQSEKALPIIYYFDLNKSPLTLKTCNFCMIHSPETDGVKMIDFNVAKRDWEVVNEDDAVFGIFEFVNNRYLAYSIDSRFVHHS